MKLAPWMAREGLDDDQVAARLSELAAAAGETLSISHHTVAKWRREERSPRDRNAMWLAALTGNEVTANDFVPEAPTPSDGCAENHRS